ncbi:hypothetical protein [Cytobacillus praedii]|uniref:hypothetical protein n=1 Tax=Cytobacillus praedii TaxID=1742358 RepID=UPI002E244F6F|nr:hypothetical protein [Cytobacillus praedii]
MRSIKIMTPHQVSVSAESFTATLLAWAGYDVSVQYGANQPEYDLIAACGEKMMKVSVKGSQDGGWGLAQSYKSGKTYGEAIDTWVNKHTGKTIVSLVQFQDVDLEKGEMPRVYLATPQEIGVFMKNMRNGYGHTSLKERHFWTSGVGKGTNDEVPHNWKFSKRRIEELINV